jgi:hypothetical protein
MNSAMNGFVLLAFLLLPSQQSQAPESSSIMDVIDPLLPDMVHVPPRERRAEDVTHECVMTYISMGKEMVGADIPPAASAVTEMPAQEIQ